MQWSRAFFYLRRLFFGLLLFQLLAIRPSAAQSMPNSTSSERSPNTQTTSTSARQTKTENNTPLQAVATVNASIAIQAGLLPHDAAKELFGGWVADHYAVVQISIGNHSRDQQFILQDVFFDYSGWLLSGLYSSEAQRLRGRQVQDYQQETKPGEISSIGALEVHDGLKSASVFSPRNTWVNGLVLLGVTAGGFAFLGPVGFTQAVTGYNSAFIPGLQKFWPDRTIDQQTNVLKYGFQDKLVIGKEEPSKTYAFFPVARFLTKGLADLYLKEPAMFFNPAELFLDPTVPISGSCNKGLRHRSDCKELLLLKQRLVDLVHLIPGDEHLNDAQILAATTSPCRSTELDTGGQKAGSKPGRSGATSVPSQSDNPATTSASSTQEDCAPEVEGVKRLMAGSSLNSVVIVVSGIMTVDVETVPAIITKVSFDKESEGEALWKDIKNKQTGIIAGKYLTNGKPMITAIKISPTGIEKTASNSAPSVNSGTTAPDKAKKEKKADSVAGSSSPASTNGNQAAATDSQEAGGNTVDEANEKDGALQVGDYIDTTSLAAVLDGSTDSELHFSLQFKKQVPSGTTLTFQVVKTSSGSVGGATSAASPSETTSSMTYDYLVDYKTAASGQRAPESQAASHPLIKTLTFKEETSKTWSAKANAIAGTITGSDLAGGTVDIKKITLPDKTTPEVTDYVTPKDLNSGTAGSNSSSLNFTLTLSKEIPPGGELTFAVTAKDKNGNEQTSNLMAHAVPKAARPKAVTPPTAAAHH
jgi:hypothetical protein